jgi:hypothetical protein
MNKPNDIVTALVSRLDLDMREAWEERAAIMEFEAGLSRDHAECLALLDLIRQRPQDVLTCFV